MPCCGSRSPPGNLSLLADDAAQRSGSTLQGAAFCTAGLRPHRREPCVSRPQSFNLLNTPHATRQRSRASRHISSRSRSNRAIVGFARCGVSDGEGLRRGWAPARGQSASAIGTQPARFAPRGLGSLRPALIQTAQRGTFSAHRSPRCSRSRPKIGQSFPIDPGGVGDAFRAHAASRHGMRVPRMYSSNIMHEGL